MKACPRTRAFRAAAVARTAVAGDAPRMHASRTAGFGGNRRDIVSVAAAAAPGARRPPHQRSNGDRASRRGAAPGDGDLVVLRDADGIGDGREHLPAPRERRDDRREADEAVHLVVVAAAVGPELPGAHVADEALRPRVVAGGGRDAADMGERRGSLHGQAVAAPLSPLLPACFSPRRALVDASR